MPNLRTKTWTTTTPAYVEDAQFWEDHLISDTDAAKAASSVQSVNNITPDNTGNVDIVALPAGGTAGQVLTKLSSTAGDADWEDPASSGHTIQDASGNDMTYRENLQFKNALVSDDSANDRTIVDCQGEKGDPGDAATITVGTVTTLPSGSQATVTNVGSTSAAVLNFGIPKGADGTGSISDAYKTVKVGSTSIVAHESDTLELIGGSNVTLTPDATNKTVTIDASGVNVANTLTSTSTTDALSAYQGNLLNAAVLLKQDALTASTGIIIESTSGEIRVDADSTPTSASPKPVQSGGVYTALGNKLNGKFVATSTSSDGRTVTFSDINPAKGYILEADLPNNYDGPAVGMENINITSTSGGYAVTYTVSNSTSGMGFDLIEIG